MDKTEIKEIVDLIKREVVPAIGCTEPIAVALCVARAAELLGEEPESISVQLSANILKNAMGVGIPGTGMIGLPIAVALGASIGRSEYGLEVLRDCSDEAVVRGRAMIDAGKIRISLKDNISEKLYIETEARSGGHSSKAVIASMHTNFIYLERDGEVLLDKGSSSEECADDGGKVSLSLRKVYDFATTAPLDDIRFILDSARLNKAAAEQSFEGDFGHGLGKTMRGTYEREIMGDSIFSHILSYTSAACDARMGGAMVPVMSNSGSGNQGIAATLPVVIFARDNGKSEDELVRALLMSHLTAIYIK
ncbi:MAG: L-serine ammonia-lyase, iron-sulfur-dependent, subunit alpha, partial [Rikenellaceae bacterium]|nr:L-serine ammonia-lyase, iron-sulfur-dependent, subunit alpha [Rikenellaceae bacterium]